MITDEREKEIRQRHARAHRLTQLSACAKGTYIEGHITWSERPMDGDYGAVELLIEHAHPDIADLLTALDEARRERDELRATLDNERGEGEPPSEGWEWRGSAWWRDLPDNRVIRVSIMTGVDIPIWRVWIESATGYDGYYLAHHDHNARAAMKAADEAAKQPKET